MITTTDLKFIIACILNNDFNLEGEKQANTIIEKIEKILKIIESEEN